MCLQTSIQTEGFRSLAEGEPVEYYLEAGDDGRTKAVQVTGPNGAPPQVGSAKYEQLHCFYTSSTIPCLREPCYMPVAESSKLCLYASSALQMACLHHMCIYLLH